MHAVTSDATIMVVHPVSTEVISGAVVPHSRTPLGVGTTVSEAVVWAKMVA